MVYIVLLYYDSRVKQLLQGGGEIKLGGDTNRDDLYIAPTIMVNVTNDHAVMQDEVCTLIFCICTYFIVIQHISSNVIAYLPLIYKSGITNTNVNKLI